jgi:tetratricopeptide (TPR) repeat protein
MYLEDKRSEDALRLFREAVSVPVVFPVDTLIAMFDVIKADEVERLRQYLTLFPVRGSLLYAGFDKVMLAMEKHGWGDHADTIREYVVNNGMPGTSAARLFIVADSYVQSKKYSRAFSTYEQLETAVANEQMTDERALKYLSGLITAIESAEMKQQPGYKHLLSKASALITHHHDQIRRNKSFDTLEELNHTAFTLEKLDEFGSAQKLYQQALQIRQLNVAANDPETINQLLDVARTAAEQKHYGEAQSLYERELAALRKDPRVDPADKVLVLENYGQLLNEMKQEARAAKIYDEARDLARKIKR